MKLGVRNLHIMLASTWRLRKTRHRKCSSFLKTKKKITFTCVLQQEYILEVKTLIVISVYCTTSQYAKLTELLPKVKLALPPSEGLSGTQWLILRVLRNTHNCAYVTVTTALQKVNSVAFPLWYKRIWPFWRYLPKWSSERGHSIRPEPMGEIMGNFPRLN
jgi:hypothetical protein